jgi:hypothetical protein
MNMTSNDNARNLVILWIIHALMLLGSYFSAFCLGIWLYEKSERSITDLSRLTFLRY